jgi:hypothetical protein
MKSLVLAAALVALNAPALAGASREAQPLVAGDSRATTVVADASRLGSASLTALNASHWSPPRERGAEGKAPFDGLAAEFDAGTLLIALGVAAVALSRPLSRALRRHEQHRRAAALASTLAGTPRR